MAVYAAGFDPLNRQPRVGLVIAGIGLSETDSEAAIQKLPSAITLAVSPYAGPVTQILASARQARHEYVLSLPMKPAGFPINDPDDEHALMPSVPPAENLSRLYWFMSRIVGYVGVTNVVGTMQGDGMMAAEDQIDPILRDVAGRGLLFVASSAAPTTLPYVWGRTADMIVDADPYDAMAIDQRLERLSAIARDKGSALGFVMLPRSVILERVAAWADRLSFEGILLAPVSALVQPPSDIKAEQ